jgi:hypothetical protein
MNSDFDTNFHFAHVKPMTDIKLKVEKIKTIPMNTTLLCVLEGGILTLYFIIFMYFACKLDINIWICIVMYNIWMKLIS